MNSAVVNTTQLAALASIVDGEATPNEIDVIVSEVSQAFNVPDEEVRGLTERLVASHQRNNVAGRPIKAVRFGQRALRGLTGREKHQAMEIANKVLAQDGLEASESSFINELYAFVRR